MKKSTTVKNGRYTYVLFAEDAITLAEGGEIANLDAFVEKAGDLLAAQIARQEYNAKNPRKSQPKGASAESKALAERISAVLSNTPMTAAEINEAIGENIPQMSISNLVDLIDGAQKLDKKVARQVEITLENGEKGITTRTYSAYIMTNRN